MKKIIKYHFLNYIVYSLILVLYYCYVKGWDYVLEILIFSSLTLITSILINYLSLKIFRRHYIVPFFIPQLIGLAFLSLIAISNGKFDNNFGYGIDEMLWTFLIATTLLNFRFVFQKI
ncbi:MAG: hypothetical protein K0Q95_195 [Bacteroidota bacterium]|jgi:hypothetical protein|nr:hypothetical protein [Bacteroidota bacterium]